MRCDTVSPVPVFSRSGFESSDLACLRSTSINNEGFFKQNITLVASLILIGLLEYLVRRNDVLGKIFNVLWPLVLLACLCGPKIIIWGTRQTVVKT